MSGQIICGDCLKVLPTLPPARTIFADPPDNLGLKYANGISDRRPNYLDWLTNGVIAAALRHEPKVFWLSHYYKYLPDILGWFRGWRSETPNEWGVRLFLWRFTFGQHQHQDCGNGYRPLLRFSRPSVKWNTDAIRIPSARQKKYHDERADPRGRVPDDVWQFSRVCGTFHERRAWHPTQHPEALMERILLMSGGPVIDLFGGTFTTQRVCDKLGIDCTSIEISAEYCQRRLREVRGTLPMPIVRGDKPSES